VHPSFASFFLHKSFCLLDDQCAFTIALLGHLLSFKNGPHVSYKKTNGSHYAMFSCSAGLELPQDFVWMYSRWSLRPTPLHTLCTTHAKHALLELVGRRLGLLLSSEATMLLALLGLGATLSREDYRRRARKGLPGATQVSFSVQPLAIPGRCQQGTKRK